MGAHWHSYSGFSLNFASMIEAELHEARKILTASLVEHAGDFAHQSPLIDWLDCMSIHAQFQKSAAGVVHYIGCQCNHRNIAPRLGSIADMPDRFQAVHNRHLNIEKDEVEIVRCKFV